MNLRDLQAEIGTWHEAQFPNVDTTRIVLKLVEETGELAREWEQRLTGKSDERCEQNEIADIAICLCALCAREGYDLETVIERKWTEVKQRKYR
jgi:NTP pyrophosphatase (non-canonical NTP hydrolase)